MLLLMIFTENGITPSVHDSLEVDNLFLRASQEKEREDAERAKRRPPLEFSSLDKARDWIRAHKTEVAFGTVVIVAGTAFIIATGGTGALILAPLAL